MTLMSLAAPLPMFAVITAGSASGSKVTLFLANPSTLLDFFIYLIYIFGILCP